jgi:hypothetical protein
VDVPDAVVLPLHEATMTAQRMMAPVLRVRRRTVCTIATSTLPAAAGRDQWRKQGISNELIRSPRAMAGESVSGERIAVPVVSDGDIASC